MKRLVIALLALGFLTSGCAVDQDAELTFKVVRFTEAFDTSVAHHPAGAVLEIDEELGSWDISVDRESVALDRLPAGIEIGDRLVCQVRSYDKNWLDSLKAEITMESCTPA
ncbi:MULTISPECIES: hypothetical protein [Actinosynnema]|uniref:hypothetical protein n=1 Tax=Actinosynnema TaxID=40566 RepID=UPI0020A4C784|nr:hypothetical protein [Actinosynnema pretiosum]MCP2093740.1 hypothetical protein [Actinosynnema pretiosum]